MHGSELSCMDFIEVVTNYLDGALSEDERQRFEDHVVQCRSCGVYLDHIRQTIKIVGRLSEESLNPEMKKTLLEAFRDWHAPNGKLR